MLLAILSSGTGLQAGYWIGYEADDFPENVGWMRVYGDENGPQQGGAERTLEDGVLTLDGLRNDQIFDFYEIQRPIDPAPGEIFLAEWKTLVDPRSDARDVGVVIARDDPPGHVSFAIGSSTLWIRDDHVTIDIEPNVFHAFSFFSIDMQEYQLAIDGTVEYEGSFDSYSILHSFVNFGDGVQGERSLSSWDYYRFGAVPEPAPLLTLLFAPAALRRFARTSARR
jgi:hypothetical protein